MNLILSALTRKLGDYRDDPRGWYHFYCPRHDSDQKKLGVNLQSMRFRCVRCNWGGAVSDLLQELGVKLELEQHRPRPLRRSELPTPPAKIPGFMSFAESTVLHEGSPDYLFYRDCLAYVKKRGDMSPGDLARSGWGWSQTGDIALRLIIPIVMEQRLVSYLARSIYDFLEPKELGGPSAAGWWPRSELMLGLDYIKPGTPLVLCEGVWDRRHLRRAIPGYSHGCLLGSHLSPSVCGRILAKRPSKIIFFLDGDAAGREGTAAGIKLLRKRRYSEVYAVRTPEGKDPDDVPALEAAELVDRAPSWLRW